MVKPTVCKILMIDLTMKEINCKHNAKCLNFYFNTVSCRPKKSGTPEQVTLLEFLLNLNSLQSDFCRPFFSPGACRKKLSAHCVVEYSLTIFGHSRYMS